MFLVDDNPSYNTNVARGRHTMCVKVTVVVSKATRGDLLQNA
jgi:hypothetical protein